MKKIQAILLALLLCLSLTNAFAEPQKPFTVTVRPVANPNAQEQLVKDCDSFYEAVNACKQEDLGNLYIITLNSDYTVPADEGYWGKSSVNMLIRSKKGKLYTLKSQRIYAIIDLNHGASLRMENIIYDGDNKSQAFFVASTDANQKATLTLGSGTIIQNFVDAEVPDSSAIYISDNGILNIEEGAIIQNNKAMLKNSFGGVIQTRSKSIVNIKGGIFKNNICARDAGVISNTGTLNITGGIFANNQAGKTSGVIYIGKNATTSIENAQFIGNKASTGGAIYAANTFTIKNTKFINNGAKYAGAIYIGKSCDIDNCVFDNNLAVVAAGAVYINAESQDIKFTNTTFNNNQTSKLGGAIYLSEGNLKISSNCKFTGNKAMEEGGAIFTKNNDYSFSVNKAGAYKNITTDNTTLFLKNYAGSGLSLPPINYDTFNNLQFSKESDVKHGKLITESLLNNYDINYKSTAKIITFDAAGGKFEDGTSEKTSYHPLNDEIELLAAPKRDGYKFVGWDNASNKPGKTYKVKDNHTFKAVWEKDVLYPRTGDSTNIALYMILLILSVSTCYIVYSKKKKLDK